MKILEKKGIRITIYNEKTDNKGLLEKYLHEGYKVINKHISISSNNKDISYVK